MQDDLESCGRGVAGHGVSALLEEVGRVSAVYEKVRVYHEAHGDDYGSKRSRDLKYKAIRDLIPHKSDRSLLDVGCGSGQFRSWVPRLRYTGIDLIYGENVMDETRHFDVVVANGLVYKLPNEREAKRLLGKCWELTDEAFIWTSLDKWGHYHVEELHLDPYEMARWARKVAGSGRVKLDMSYLPGDFAILMLR